MNASLMMIIRRSLAIIGVAAVMILAWMPWPPLLRINENGMPAFLRRALHFFGVEDFVCNVLAFLILTVVVLPLFPRPKRLRCALGLVVLVAVLELGQLWMPHRFFDLTDILAGWLGVVIGGVPWLWPRRRPTPARQDDKTP